MAGGPGTGFFSHLSSSKVQAAVNAASAATTRPPVAASAEGAKAAGASLVEASRAAAAAVAGPVKETEKASDSVKSEADAAPVREGQAAAPDVKEKPELTQADKDRKAEEEKFYPDAEAVLRHIERSGTFDSLRNSLLTHLREQQSKLWSEAEEIVTAELRHNRKLQKLDRTQDRRELLRTFAMNYQALTGCLADASREKLLQKLVESTWQALSAETTSPDEIGKDGSRRSEGERVWYEVNKAWEELFVYNQTTGAPRD
eukprot:scaffold4_cov396-Prasinococcus_capsulatus_cf.AAC.23